ncbi:MAG: RNA polymerase sigma factor RpoD/SigA [Spirochaetota bacterium]|nr:MAG: RNA polymerase sigma factor RpoD/SigA [Spirochaetota bacterium]
MKKRRKRLSVDKRYSELGSGLDVSSLSVYLREINKIPLLTRQEEVDLARSARDGDQYSKDRLIQANLRFVVNVAKKYQNQGLTLSDLISEGNLGLITAVDKFDVDKGYHFISYAVWWIKQSILKAICEKSRMIRLPLNRANELLQIEKVKREIGSNKDGEADIEEIADFLDMDKSRINDLINASKEFVSLETPLSSDKDANTISDLMEDTKGADPEEVLIDQTLQESIEKVLSTLTEKESNVIRYRFGLNGERPHSLKEIGDKYNLTKERIRQIEKKAISRLRHPSRSQKLKSYVRD